MSMIIRSNCPSMLRSSTIRRIRVVKWASPFTDCGSMKVFSQKMNSLITIKRIICGFHFAKLIYVLFSCWTISAQRWRPIRRDRTLSVSSQTNQQKFPPDLNVVMQMGPAHHLVTGRLPQHDTSQFASKFHCPGSYREELERRSHHSRRLFTGQCNQNECLRHSRLWNRSRLWSSLPCSSCEHYKRNAGRFVSLKEIWIKIYQAILFII